ncbi:MAG: hypothetical protein JSV24_10780 [Bacteroidales bacterium]|nr:MAG: hypothetical protein JSV24_10780 [Bacteroidales bacterium]
MKTKNISLLFAMVVTLLPGLSGCKSDVKQTEGTKIQSSSVSVSDSVTGNFTPLAVPITYDVVIKNPDSLDIWTTTCLENLKREILVDLIFNALKEGRVKAFNYHTDEEMSWRDIRALEREDEFDRSRIAKVQFIEEWYFDPNAFKLEKKVNSIMLAYEVFDRKGNIRGYKAAFRVDLN